MLKVEKISIIDQVITQLENAITSGEYAVGEKMPAELELCGKLGVGRSTVREAYRMLQALGMIELRPGRGAFVKSQNRNTNTEESIREWFVEKESELTSLMEVRMAVEPLAVKLAIQKGSAEQIASIIRINKKFQQASQQSNMVELVELDEHFHTAIVEASNNQLLVKINRLIVETFKEYRTKAFSVKENVDHASSPHAEIVEAINDNNTDKGIESMNRHLAISLADIENVISKMER